MSEQQSESLLGGEDRSIPFHDPYPEASEATIAVEKQPSHPSAAAFPGPIDASPVRPPALESKSPR